MKKSLIAISLVIIIALAVIPIIDSTSAEDTATINGIIKINGEIVKNENIVISFYGYPPNIAPVKVTGINENGEFTMAVPAGLKPDVCMMSFMLEGCSVNSLPSTISEQKFEKSEIETCYYLSNELTGGGTLVSGKTYNLCEDDMHCINVDSSYGTITGQVNINTSAQIGLNDVKISIIDEKGIVKKTTVTSNGGKYTIESCPTGMYTIRYVADSYETIENTVVVEKGVIIELPNVTMKKVESLNDNAILQITILVALIISVIIILFVIIDSIRAKTTGKRILVWKK